MSEWQEKLNKLNSLLKELFRRKEKNLGELRFSRCSIRASDVAGQYYCERKVELEYLFGEVVKTSIQIEAFFVGPVGNWADFTYDQVVVSCRII